MDVFAEDGCPGCNGDDSVPRKRRRQPCPDGIQHAAAGGSLLKTESPIVGTGMEYKAAVDSGVAVVSKHDGVIEKVSADEVVLKEDNGVSHTYKLIKFMRSNQGTLCQPAPDCEKRRACQRRARFCRRSGDQQRGNQPGQKTPSSAS